MSPSGLGVKDMKCWVKCLSGAVVESGGVDDIEGVNGTRKKRKKKLMAEVVGVDWCGVVRWRE